MQSDNPATRGRVPTIRAVRHHLAPVIACLVLGALAGWLYAGSESPTYTSVSRVLVNPSVGNPYAPTPSSVRQDELTSLQTEAQVVRSVEVLDAVVEQRPGLTTRELERGLQVTVPPNTQVLEISYSAGEPSVAQEIADAVATAYLDNRAERFDEVNSARIDRVATRTRTVVAELRDATEAAEVGTVAERAFQSELADALRSELVGLRAQRTALESSETPPGAVISPASTPADAPQVTAVLFPVGGALVGLAIGCLVAVLLERATGVVRSAAEVEGTALPVVAAVARPRWRGPLSRRHRNGEAFDTMVRRLRATLLDLEPRPDVITLAPAGAGGSDADVSEAVAESFARIGHRVVLVQTDVRQTRGGLDLEERGVADALLHELVNPLDLLRPTVEPLLCLLPAGVPTEQSRELFVADRLRALIAQLVEAGNLVVIQSPGVDTTEGEALVGAADLALIVVTVGVTRPREVEQVTMHARTRGTVLGALVVGPRDAARRTRRIHDEVELDPGRKESDAPSRSTRASQ